MINRLHLRADQVNRHTGATVVAALSDWREDNGYRGP